MKKNVLSLFLTVVLVISVSLLMVAPVAADKPNDCATIQDGTLLYAAGHYLGGQPLEVGYDVFGYNYQAHQFKGSYFNSYAGKAGFPPWSGDDEAYLTENPGAASHWAWPYRDVQLTMKWSDIWLSNKSCDTNGVLDRGGPGGTNSAANGSWLTNHQRGTDEKGNWTYYVKIVYPTDGEIPEGAEVIWTSFIVLQRVDSGVGATNYAQPVGFGAYK